jgi:ribosomal protein S18 acetylase RimI-like enzyme
MRLIKPTKNPCKSAKSAKSVAYSFEVRMSEIVLREASDDDIATIVAITRVAFDEYTSWLNPPSGAPNETPEKVRAKLVTGSGVLALIGDRVVGSVYYRAEAEHVYLGRLAVLPEYRGRGVGAALVAEVERRAREMGIARVRLGVRVALPHLRARYERLGYQVYEERTHEGFAEPTYLMMEKLL